MLSGTFHATSQEWRYYSREKALIHTLHLAQLPDTRIGETVTIAIVPPTGSAGNNFSVPPLNFPPITPFGGINWTKINNNISPFWTDRLVTGSVGFYTNFFDTGQYTFNDLPLRQDVGTWYKPVTGGTYLFEGSYKVTLDVGSAGSVVNMIANADLTTTNPLDGPPNGGGPPPPTDYAAVFWNWKIYWQLAGSFDGGMNVPDAGNAVSVKPFGMIQDVGYMTWIGEHLLNQHIGNDPPGALIYRLAPPP